MIPHSNRSKRLTFSGTLVTLMATLTGASVLWAADVAPAAGSAGIVEGMIAYRAGSVPWRYARYYVRDARSGLLAEAVVTLRSRSLSGLSPRPAPATRMVDQKNFQFVPETIAIRAGDFVQFTNSDRETHNVRTSGRLANFNVNTLPGVPYTHKFGRAGGIRQPATLGCVYHGAMRAWIFVFDHPFYKVTGEDGGFRWEDVPPGSYVLEAFHPAGGMRWSSEIVVTADQTLTAPIELTIDAQ